MVKFSVSKAKALSTLNLEFILIIDRDTTAKAIQNFQFDNFQLPTGYHLAKANFNYEKGILASNI